MEAPYRAGKTTPMPDSLWADVTPPAPDFATLSGQHDTEDLVVGGGYLGLSTALALAERGRTVVVIEAAKVGWGASGRNNGLIAAGLKRDPHEVRAMLGKDRGDRLLAFSGTAPEVVFDLVDRFGIACDLRRRGWIQAAHSTRSLAVIERRVRDWRALGADVAMIPRYDVANRLGTDFYTDAWFDARGASLNPLAYARGLVRAVVGAGARVHERTPAIEIEAHNGGWLVRTPHARIRAEHVAWCTNAYDVHNDALRGTVMPVRTAQVASEPLPKSMTSVILPGGESCSDTQRLLTSFRLTADNRLIMGGASATAGDEHRRLVAHLHRAARRRFPHLGDIPWAFGWSGYLALTPTHLPQILEVGNGYYAGTGCNGRGIAMATATGAAMADLICGQDRNECSVPVTRPKRVFGYAMRHVGVAGGVLVKRLLDTTEHRLFA